MLCQTVQRNSGFADGPFSLAGLSLTLDTLCLLVPMDLQIPPDHHIWSILTEDMVLELLVQIPALSGHNIPSGLSRLIYILLQHPQVLPSSYASLHELITPVNNPVSVSPAVDLPSDVEVSQPPAVDASELPSSAEVLSPPANQVPEPEPDTHEPVGPSKGVCYRNGTKVGLRGSGSSKAEKEEGGPTKSGSKRKGVDKDSGEGSGPSKKPKKSPGGSKKDTAIGPAAIKWLTDGSPPKLDCGAEILFAQLASLSSSDVMVSLTGLMHHLTSGQPLESTSLSYDLSFSSIVTQCSNLASAKAVRDFHVAILYIRLAVHIDQ